MVSAVVEQGSIKKFSDMDKERYPLATLAGSVLPQSQAPPPTRDFTPREK